MSWVWVDVVLGYASARYWVEFRQFQDFAFGVRALHKLTWADGGGLGPYGVYQNLGTGRVTAGSCRWVASIYRVMGLVSRGTARHRSGSILYRDAVSQAPQVGVASCSSKGLGAFSCPVKMGGLTLSIAVGKNGSIQASTRTAMTRILYSAILAFILSLTIGQVHAEGAGIEWKILNDETLELLRTGQYERGVKVAQAALKVAEQNVGPEHPDVATSLNNLAALYDKQGDYAKAEPLYKRSLAIWEKGPCAA